MDEQAHAEPVGQEFNYNQDYHRMSDFLGVNIYDRSDENLARKVSALHNWASDKTGKKDLNSVLVEVSKLQKSLGVNFIGKTLVTELYKHMRLSQENEKPHAPIQVAVPSMLPKPKESKKVIKSVKVQSPVQKAVTQTVQGSIKDMVTIALKDKTIMESAVKSAIKEALK